LDVEPQQADFMSRTLRKYTGRWRRSAPSTQQERRQYFASLDQEIPIYVRPKRGPENLPDCRTELKNSSEKMTFYRHAWLWKQLGKPWNVIFSEATASPGFRPHGFNRSSLGDFVVWRTYIRKGKVWGIFRDGSHIQTPSGFFIDPTSGLLVHRDEEYLWQLELDKY
jgi:hypothetical protein